MTVPNLEEAVDFFARVIGATLAYERRTEAGSAPDHMVESFNAHPKAGFRLAKLYLGRTGLELFEYTAPDQRRDQPRNCDVGGSHLGFLVADMDRALRQVAAYPGARVLGDAHVLPADHPLAGRTWVYVLTPWGQQLELVCDG